MIFGNVKEKFEEFRNFLNVIDDGGNGPDIHTADINEDIVWLDLKKGKRTEKAIILGVETGGLWLYFWGKPDEDAGEQLIQAAKDEFGPVTITRTSESAYIRIGCIYCCSLNDIKSISNKIKKII